MTLSGQARQILRTDSMFRRKLTSQMSDGLKRILELAVPVLVVILWHVGSSGWVHAQSNETEVRIRLDSGLTSTVDLKKIDNQLVFVDRGHGLEQLDLAEVVQLQFADGFTELVPSRFDICLSDASRLKASKLSLSENQATVELAGGWAIGFPARMVQWIALRDYASDPQLSREWKILREDENRTSDAILVNRAGELEAIEGVVGSLQNDKLEFRIGERSANVDLEKLDAVLFFRVSGQTSSPAMCRVRLQDGSLLNCQRIGWSDKQVRGTTVAGFEFSLPESQLESIDFSLGREIYLDRLTPTTNDWKPLLASTATMEALRKLNLARANQSYDGQALSLLFENGRGPQLPPEKRQFDHGFAMRGGGKLAFRLDENVTTLSGWVGFDPLANQNGEVLLTIRVDGSIAVEKPLRKREMTNPYKIEMNVRGARRIVFQVGYLDGRSVGDQIHLADLKVAK